MHDAQSCSNLTSEFFFFSSLFFSHDFPFPVALPYWQTMHLTSKLTLVGVAAGWLLAAGAAESGLAARQRLADSPFDWQTLAVRRALREAAATKRDTQYRNSTSISKSFDTVTLFDGWVSPSKETGEEEEKEKKQGEKKKRTNL